MTICLLMHHISCRVLWWSIKSPRLFTPLQPRSGTLRLLAFSKTKITFEREEISDSRWDSGDYNKAADGRTVWSLKVSTLKGTEMSLSCIQCLVSCNFFNKCFYFLYYMAGYLLDRRHCVHEINLIKWLLRVYTLCMRSSREKQGRTHGEFIDMLRKDKMTRLMQRLITCIVGLVEF